MALEVVGSKAFSAIVNIIFGILVLSFPKFLRYVVGIYFLLTGLLMLL
jgi:uncharacterized membrane protein HdeD (DUF308 family)